MIKVLFVCTGNICRSPMAEAVFQDMVNKAGLGDKFVIDSAGTDTYHVGERTHSGTIRVLKKHGINYDSRSRRVTHADLGKFDYILAMDTSHVTSLQRMTNGEDSTRVELFLEKVWKDGLVNVDEVPDPWYDGRFDEVYDLVVRGCDSLFKRIRAEHRL